MRKPEALFPMLGFMLAFGTVGAFAGLVIGNWQYFAAMGLAIGAGMGVAWTVRLRPRGVRKMMAEYEEEVALEAERNRGNTKSRRK